MNDETQIGLELEHAKKMTEKRDALLRLVKNADFDLVVQKGYFEIEPARLVIMKSDSSMDSEEHQASLDRDIIGIGSLYQYFRAIMAEGNQCDQAIADYEEELDRIRAEGLDS